MYPEIDFATQYKAIPNRRYRFDFAHLDSKVAIEIQGGIWVKSGHTTGKGLQNSYAKLNLASYHGWKVFQLSSDMINPTWLTIIYLAMMDRQKKQR
jgi:very-short-patch-repair endonuclease